ncbi:hypothetical protein [Leptolyngbya sp. PCC 6406]|uniref:hypothetical protein n=1 Tax=Leptolyngbya sp. PCC 6406 TaxID=1173264 RepID=UPI00031FE848|nr:hypothetical protein [Leptolyngbya sp. PCC 6406]
MESRGGSLVPWLCLGTAAEALPLGLGGGAATGGSQSPAGSQWSRAAPLCPGSAWVPAAEALPLGCWRRSRYRGLPAGDWEPGSGYG